jgi:hypothetical protein
MPNTPEHGRKNTLIKQSQCLNTVGTGISCRSGVRLRPLVLHAASNGSRVPFP